MPYGQFVPKIARTGCYTANGIEADIHKLKKEPRRRGEHEEMHGEYTQ